MPALKRWECACGQWNKAKASTCAECGEDNPNPHVPAVASKKPRGPRRCPADDTILEPDGFCRTGGGYPKSMACPFTCPICRNPELDWDGGCQPGVDKYGKPKPGGCHGSRTPSDRTTWTFPGERYELGVHPGEPEDMRLVSVQLADYHWRRVPGDAGRAGRPAVSVEENITSMRILRRLLSAPGKILDADRSP